MVAQSCLRFGDINLEEGLELLGANVFLGTASLDRFWIVIFLFLSQIGTLVLLTMFFLAITNCKYPSL